MSLYEDLPLSDLDRKARAVFGDHVVVKSLAQHAALHGLPRYVSEYLIAKYVHHETWREDLTRVQAKIKDLLPDLERREWLKDRLLRTGEITLIDALEARVDLRNGQRWVRVPAINDEKVRVSGPLLEQNPGLLLGGLWGTAKIRYSPESIPIFQMSSWPSLRSRWDRRMSPVSANRGRSSAPTSGSRSCSKAPVTPPRPFPVDGTGCCF